MEIGAGIGYFPRGVKLCMNPMRTSNVELTQAKTIVETPKSDTYCSKEYAIGEIFGRRPSHLIAESVKAAIQTRVRAKSSVRLICIYSHHPNKPQPLHYLDPHHDAST